MVNDSAKDSSPISNDAAETPRRSRSARKAWWTKQFYVWHWVSSAICLASMLLFAVTGITLNHAGSITAKPVVTETVLTLTADHLAALAVGENEEEEFKAPLPRDVRRWLEDELDASIGGRAVDWSSVDIYIDLPRPGGDGWMSIDRETGEVIHETTSRGFIAYINDLHKGRDTGFEWILFMDIFSVACVLFCLTGLALLFVHAKRRPSTWPVVIAGIVLPVAVLMIFVHS
jgi:hypothetical protein